MKNDPSLVKIACPFGEGDVWIQATPTCLAFLDFRADPDGTECLRVPTGTDYEKRRAVDALRSAADFLESKLE
jgi:hypothetical protein